MKDDENFRLEKLKIHERLGKVEQSIAKVESRLFENGILSSMNKLIEKIDTHISEDEKNYGRIDSLQSSQRIIIILFSGMTLGLLFKLLI